MSQPIRNRSLCVHALLMKVFYPGGVPSLGEDSREEGTACWDTEQRWNETKRWKGGEVGVCHLHSCLTVVIGKCKYLFWWFQTLSYVFAGARCGSWAACGRRWRRSPRARPGPSRRGTPRSSGSPARCWRRPESDGTPEIRTDPPTAALDLNLKRQKNNQWVSSLMHW